MSIADKDGRVAQMLSDRLACLGMSMHESLRESEAALRPMLRALDEASGHDESARPK